MEWADWKNKWVFLQTKKGGVYSGEVIDIDSRDLPLIFITIIDKFGKKVMFEHSEIIKIAEEDKDKAEKFFRKEKALEQLYEEEEEDE